MTLKAGSVPEKYKSDALALNRCVTFYVIGYTYNTQSLIHIGHYAPAELSFLSRNKWYTKYRLAAGFYHEGYREAAESL